MNVWSAAVCGSDIRSRRLFSEPPVAVTRA